MYRHLEGVYLLKDALMNQPCLNNLFSANPIIELPKWLDLYLKELKTRNSSQRTIHLTIREVEKFIEFCREEEISRMDSIGKYLMKSYFLSLSENFKKRYKREISAETLNLSISRLKVFFSFISDNNDDFFDLSESMSKIKKSSKKEEKLETFSQDECKKIIHLLHYLPKHTKNIHKKKILLAITIFFYGGLRSAELLSLTPNNFSLYENKDGEEFYALRFEGKGGKKREIPIRSIHLEEYQAFLSKESLKRNEKIFSFTYYSLYRSIKSFLKKAGVSTKYSNHSFRHNLATMFLQQGVNLQIISEFLGHSSVAVTAKYYSRVSLEDKSRVVG